MACLFAALVIGVISGIAANIYRRICVCFIFGLYQHAFIFSRQSNMKKFPSCLTEKFLYEQFFLSKKTRVSSTGLFSSVCVLYFRRALTKA